MLAFIDVLACDDRESLSAEVDCSCLRCAGIDAVPMQDAILQLGLRGSSEFPQPTTARLSRICEHVILRIREFHGPEANRRSAAPAFRYGLRALGWFLD